VGSSNLNLEGKMASDDKCAVGTEDQRKLHAEVNQILNQRFLVTTAAITVFGVFTSLIIPKDPSPQNVAILGRLVFAGAAFLQLFLLLLFAWNRSLANLQSNIAIYLVVNRASKWEVDWRKFHPQRGVLTTGLIQHGVFLALGVLTVLLPIVISMACSLPLEPGWVLFELAVAALYFVGVFGFGLKQWLRNEQQIENQWRTVLALPADGKTNDQTVASPARDKATTDQPLSTPPQPGESADSSQGTT
jgi:hypothetical protein